MDKENYGFRLIGENPLQGYRRRRRGHVSCQEARDGRRILWLAHEGAAEEFHWASDVTDPDTRRSLSRPGCRIEGAVHFLEAAATSRGRLSDVRGRAHPAGFELFDIGDPRAAALNFLLHCSGPYLRGVHQLWFVDGEHVHLAGGAADFRAAQSARRPDLPRRQCAESHEARRAGPLVDARAAGVTRAAARTPADGSTPGFAPTTPMSIRKRPDRA